MEKRFIVYWTNFLFSSVLFRKKCPHVQWTMSMSQYDKHTLHCVVGSVSSISLNSMFPISWIVFWIFDWRDYIIGFVVGLVEEHVGSGGSRFSESILERWQSATASQ